MLRILERIYESDPYVEFPSEDYPVDVQGWGFQDPVFEEVIREISPHVIIEVGTWKGASAIHMANLCRNLDLRTEIVCIDTWLGSSELITERADPRWRASLKYRFGYPQLFYTFMRNVLDAGFSDIITPLPASSDAAFFALRKLGVTASLIYIDGSHEYEAVTRDLELYSRLLAPGGVIIGDDFKSIGVQRAAQEFSSKGGYALVARRNKYILRIQESNRRQETKQPKSKKASTKLSKRKYKENTKILEVSNVSMDDLVQRVDTRVPFSISRWGDCEWHIVFGRTEGQNLDRHRYMPGLVADLNRILKSRPSYMLGLQPLARRFFEGRIESWLFKKHLNDLNWIESDVLHIASIRGQLGKFIDSLQKAPRFVVVGPPHLADTRAALGFSSFIEVPRENCYLEKDRLVDETIELARQLPFGSVMTFSATATANILVDELHKRFGDHITLIDVGSLWDPYAGVKSRRYMQAEDFAVSAPKQ